MLLLISRVHTKGVSQILFLSEDTFISGGNDGVVAVWKLSQSMATITTTKPEAASSDVIAKKGRRQKSGKNKTTAQKSQPETKVTVQTVIEPLTLVQHGEAINWISVLKITKVEEAAEGDVISKESSPETTSKVEAESPEVAEVDNQSKSTSSDPVTNKLKRIVVAVADSSCDIVLYEIDV